MRQMRLLRALLGSAGLAACIGLLAERARAETLRFVPQPNAGKSVSPTTGQIAPVSPNLFGTIAVPARVQRFDAAWRRATLDASSLPSMQRLVAPARTLGRDRQIAYVQAAVTRTIRWMSDATEWGQHDYWASAAETLQHGAGDMEDRAIVKLQALRTLGVPARDLYLTIGRDPVGGPITVLLVRVDRRFYVLDDLGGSPIPSERRHGFQPIVTFVHNASWIHGRKVATTKGTGATDAARR